MYRLYRKKLSLQLGMCDAEFSLFHQLFNCLHSIIQMLAALHDSINVQLLVCHVQLVFHEEI